MPVVKYGVIGLSFVCLAAQGMKYQEEGERFFDPNSQLNMRNKDTEPSPGEISEKDRLRNRTYGSFFDQEETSPPRSSIEEEYNEHFPRIPLESFKEEKRKIDDGVKFDIGNPEETKTLTELDISDDENEDLPGNAFQEENGQNHPQLPAPEEKEERKGLAQWTLESLKKGVEYTLSRFGRFW